MIKNSNQRYIIIKNLNNSQIEYTLQALQKKDDKGFFQKFSITLLKMVIIPFCLYFFFIRPNLMFDNNTLKNLDFLQAVFAFQGMNGTVFEKKNIFNMKLDSYYFEPITLYYKLEDRNGKKTYCIYSLDSKWMTIWQNVFLFLISMIIFSKYSSRTEVINVFLTFDLINILKLAFAVFIYIYCIKYAYKNLLFNTILQKAEFNLKNYHNEKNIMIKNDI